MDMETSDRTAVRALAAGINITALRGSIEKLEAACNRKIEAQEDFKNAIDLAALQNGILSGVLSQYIIARCTDTVKKKAQSAAQLQLLFEEIG
jgi:hypothetical protein